MDKVDLTAEIIAAFDGVSREDGVTLHQTQVLDAYGTYEEELVAREKDTETRWQDVPEDDIRGTDAVLSFLDPKGFRYYLPAYMLAYLKYWDDEFSDNRIGEEVSLLFHLGVGYPTAFADDGHHLPKFTVLNRPQSTAVAHFLQYLTDDMEEDNSEFDVRRQALIEKIKNSEAEQSELDEMDRLYGRWDDEPNEIKEALDRYWAQFL